MLNNHMRRFIYTFESNLMRKEGRYDKRRVTFYNAVAVLFVACLLSSPVVLKLFKNFRLYGYQRILSYHSQSFIFKHNLNFLAKSSKKQKKKKKVITSANIQHFKMREGTRNAQCRLIRPTRGGQKSNENRPKKHVIFVTTKRKRTQL